MNLKVAYVRLGNRKHIAELVSIGEPLPEQFFDTFGDGHYGDGHFDIIELVPVNSCRTYLPIDYLLLKLKNVPVAQLAIACDWLRERDWSIWPDGNVTLEGIGDLTKKSLLERGWTNGMIDKYLAHPDKEVDNPHYKTAPDMRLYAIQRVAFVESRPEVAPLIARKLAKRKAKVEA